MRGWKTTLIITLWLVIEDDRLLKVELCQSRGSKGAARGAGSVMPPGGLQPR
jgi:hypothetical protein